MPYLFFVGQGGLFGLLVWNTIRLVHYKENKYTKFDAVINFAGIVCATIGYLMKH
jgi:hypothetical protein